MSKYTVHPACGILARENGEPVAAFCRSVAEEEMRKLADAPEQVATLETQNKLLAWQVSRLEHLLEAANLNVALKDSSLHETRELVGQQRSRIARLQERCRELEVQAANLRALAEAQGERMSVGLR